MEVKRGGLRFDKRLMYRDVLSEVGKDVSFEAGGFDVGKMDINRLAHHGLNRCLDKGLHGFKRYCAPGVLAANLRKLGNVILEKVRFRSDTA